MKPLGETFIELIWAAIADPDACDIPALLRASNAFIDATAADHSPTGDHGRRLAYAALDFGLMGGGADALTHAARVLALHGYADHLGRRIDRLTEFPG